MVTFLGILACNAQDVRLAKALIFHDGVFASRRNDSWTYVLIGGGWIFGIRSDDPTKFISVWLAKHPAATIKPISRMVLPAAGGRDDLIEYIWIEDGTASLNVDLVRAGLYPAPAMADMVDFRKQLDQTLQDPRMAAQLSWLEKHQPEVRQALILLPKPERLISDEDYQQRVRRTEAAAALARREKLGVWSDAMKEERESLGGR